MPSLNFFANERTVDVAEFRWCYGLEPVSAFFFYRCRALLAFALLCWQNSIGKDNQTRGIQILTRIGTFQGEFGPFRGAAQHEAAVFHIMKTLGEAPSYRRAQEPSGMEELP